MILQETSHTKDYERKLNNQRVFMNMWFYIKKKESQCTCTVTLLCFRVTTVAIETQTQSLFLFFSYTSLARI